jgi:GTPase SAR1 family protein
VKEHSEAEVVIMLVGNKLDACEEDPLKRKVSMERAMEFAKLNGLHFMETSAFTDINVSGVFEMLIQEIYNLKRKDELLQTRRNLEG